MIYDHAVKAFGKIYFAGETVPEQEKQSIPPSEQVENPEMTVPEQPLAPKRTSKAKGKAAC